jgi:epoxyqueuosine reductase
MVILEAKHIKKVALDAGFDLCGVTSCHSFPINRAAFEGWLKEGYDSSLNYMRNNIDMRFDVGQMVEGARSVVVCAVSYKSEISGGYSDADKCKIASYACNRDYHKTLKKMLKAMLRELQTTYPSLEGRAFVDSAPILEKQYAVEAGLGWIGRQSLLVTPEYGTYVLLGELVLNAEVDELDKPMEGVGCGECRRCMDACPTGAIVKPMTINTSRCISCHTIEAEPSAKINLNGWIFGCDECQNCCPYNKKAKPHNSSAFNPLFDPREITAEQWMTMTEEYFAEKFGSTPLKRSGLERIKANIRRD